MAVEILYEAREIGENGDYRAVSRRFSTDMEAIQEIRPEEDQVVIHSESQTILVPFDRVYELKIDRDRETVEEIKQ